MREIAYPDMKLVRDRLRSEGVCINGPRDGSSISKNGVVHGPVVQGGRCQRCVEIWRQSK